MNEKGKFIVLEGCDGSGKTTVLNRLKEKYKNNNKVLFLKETESTGLGKVVKDIILSKSKNMNLEVASQLYLFTAARVELIEKVIKPKLKEGYTIFCDRFALSTWAYQSAMDNRLSSIIQMLLSSIAESIEVDKTIYLSLDIDTAFSRINKRSEEVNNEFDKKDKVMFGAILLWYNMGLMGVEFPKILLGDVHKIDASMNPDEVYAAVVKAIDNKN